MLGGKGTPGQRERLPPEAVAVEQRARPQLARLAEGNEVGVELALAEAVAVAGLCEEPEQCGL